MQQPPSELQNQIIQQPVSQQVILCPVRLVYDTQILVRPEDSIQPNQTIFIRQQNTPPWLGINQQQPRLMYTQMTNDAPSLHYDMAQNQLYSHNTMNYQPTPNTMLVQNQQIPQLQLSHVMPCNMMENAMTNIGTNIRNVPNLQTFANFRPVLPNIQNNPNMDQRILNIENNRVDQAMMSFQGHSGVQKVGPDILVGRQEQNILKPQETVAINTLNTSNITDMPNTSCSTIVPNVPRMPNAANITNVSNTPRIVSNSNKPNMINVLNAPKITNILNTPIFSNVSNTPIIPNNPNIINISNSTNVQDLHTSNITNVPNTPIVQNNTYVTNISNNTRALSTPNIPTKKNVPNITNIPNKTNVSKTYIPNITSIINVPKTTNILNTPSNTSVPNMPIIQNNTNVPHVTNIPNNTLALNTSNIPSQIIVSNTTSMTDIPNTTNISNIPDKTNIPNNTSNINIPYTTNIPNTTSITNKNKTNNCMVTFSNNTNNSYIRNASKVPNVHNLKDKSSDHLNGNAKQKLAKTEDVCTNTIKNVSQQSNLFPNFKVEDANNIPQKNTDKILSGNKEKVKDTFATYAQRLPNQPYTCIFKSINDRRLNPIQTMLVVNEESNEESIDLNKKVVNPVPIKINDLMNNYQNEAQNDQIMATIAINQRNSLINNEKVTNAVAMNFNDVTTSLIHNDQLKIVEGNNDEGKNTQIKEKRLVKNKNIHINKEVGSPKASDSELKTKSTIKRKYVKNKNKKKIAAENEVSSTADEGNEVYNKKEKCSQYQLRKRKYTNDKNNKNRSNNADNKKKKNEVKDKAAFIDRGEKGRKCYYGKILTHVVEGIVIQESDVAFAIREPLKDKESQSNTQNSNKQDTRVSTLSNDTAKRKRNANKCVTNSTTSDECDDEKDDNEGNDAKDRLNGRGDLFENLKKTDVMTWTVDQLVTYLANHGWTETALLLREHEIDGQSLFLANKQQFINIGVIENHADIISEFIQL